MRIQPSSIKPDMKEVCEMQNNATPLTFVWIGKYGPFHTYVLYILTYNGYSINFLKN